MAGYVDMGEGGGPVWLAEARRLREAGVSVREVAARLGLPRSTVHDALKGREHCRRRREARAPSCPECGGPMNVGAKSCGRCVHARAEKAAREFERLWNEGRTHAEIAAHFGWGSPQAVGVYAKNHRARGYRIPFRYSDDRRRRMREGHRQRVAA